ncbi:dihydroorotate dehydrogenase (fumarate) [Malonomonas rubra DSM 5091]|uniref:Dihydroorotate dehydrogenase (Fumarate) n=1 Tax=Malonomonas rubra DSM 5091 TaxID=1122189 RepID=A0A1M6H3E0_MALRU|nr:dihydroorotate dehydrogenase-like protein [Malonomonas rubra]SHJ16747.1 dihydroorotate dehydrogenase (fumarate) [Malonomonas rubra DSM 5091]
MLDLSTKFMGLSLKNPIIAGSSGLSSSVAGIKKLEEGGAGAIVLKSIFEEEILHEMNDLMKDLPETSRYLERFDTLDLDLKSENLKKYKSLISDAKSAVAIPIVASINCTYSYDWIEYAEHLESAGADALELNMFFLPTDLERSADEMERAYFNVIEKVLNKVSIPVALKISPYFTCLGQTIQKLSTQGISGLTLFNRFYSPDFDIEELKVTQNNILSTPGDLAISLRWMALMSQKVDCDLAASTGVHDGEAVIKQLLAGAQAVQVVSTLYKNGPFYIQTMLDQLKDWMTRHGHSKLEDFRGKMSQNKSTNPATYERVQFMKYFSGYEEIL